MATIAQVLYFHYIIPSRKEGRWVKKRLSIIRGAKSSHLILSRLLFCISLAGTSVSEIVFVKEKQDIYAWLY
jgi:hypothetical protein